MEPDKIMDGISKEILTALKAMGNAKTLEEKLAHSAVIKNLCESLAVFLNLMSDIDLYDDDIDEGPIPF